MALTEHNGAFMTTAEVDPDLWKDSRRHQSKHGLQPYTWFIVKQKSQLTCEETPEGGMSFSIFF